MAKRLPFYPDPPRNPMEEIARLEIAEGRRLTPVERQRVSDRRSGKEPKMLYQVVPWPSGDGYWLR